MGIELVKAQNCAKELGLSSEFHKWDMNSLPPDKFLPMIYTKRASINKENDKDRVDELKEFADELIKYVQAHIVMNE